MVIGEEQRRCFQGLYRQYGDDPRSTSHRSRAIQYERYARIAKCFERESGSFRVHDIGCGLGHFGEFLKDRFEQAIYSGSEICEEFVEACRVRFPDHSFQLRNVATQLPDDRYDYVIACGTFNNRLGVSRNEWQNFVFSTLRAMYAMSTRGIAADFLTTYHDPEYARKDLHYQDEKQLMDFVASELSRHAEFDMSGPLYEYTMRAYRPELVRALHRGAEFDRYFPQR